MLDVFEQTSISRLVCRKTDYLSFGPDRPNREKFFNKTQEIDLYGSVMSKYISQLSNNMWILRGGNFVDNDNNKLGLSSAKLRKSCVELPYLPV